MTPRQMCLDLIEFGGMTQADIARAVGYSTAGVCRILSRGHRTVRYETGKRLEVLYQQRREIMDAAKAAKVAEIKASLKAVL